MRARARHFNDPIYDVEFYVLRCPFAQLEPWIVANLTTEFEIGEEGDAHTMIGKGAKVITFWFPPKVDIDLGVIAHEAVHGACSVLRDRGIRFTTGAEEALAYYVGYLVREIMERL